MNQSAQMQDDLIWRLVDVKANLLSKRHMFIKYFSLLIYFCTYLRNLNIMNIQYNELHVTTGIQKTVCSGPL